MPPRFSLSRSGTDLVVVVVVVVVIVVVGATLFKKA